MPESRTSKKPISLHPLSFKEAMTYLVRTGPPRSARTAVKRAASKRPMGSARVESDRGGRS